MRMNGGVCYTEIASNRHGFFCHMTWCLFILHYCERYGLIPDIRFTGDNYLDRKQGSNWLAHYFELSWLPILEQPSISPRYTAKISRWEQIGPPADPVISINEGVRTLNKYLRPKRHINKKVDDFWRTFPSNGPVVGVHFRGTDKLSEAPRVSWQHCLKIINNYLQAHPTTQAVFVASDEQRFCNFIKESVNDVPVYSHDDHYRSSNSRDMFHMTTGEGSYERGKDALVNALLLSRCSTLIRTTSFLSAWASVFNPDLKVILLNKPYDKMLWYPECEVVSKPDTQYLPESPG